MKDLNLINKILTIVFLGIALYFCNNDIFIYLVSIVLVTCLFNVRSFIMGILGILVIAGKLFNLEMPNTSRIYYLIIMIGIINLMVKSFTIKQKQYIFDKTLYKWKDMKLTRKHIYNCYYDMTFNNNINAIKKYDHTNSYRFLYNQADIKAKRDLSDIYILNRIRFYQIYNKKRVFFPDKWRKTDTVYLIAMILMLFIILYFR